MPKDKRPGKANSGPTTQPVGNGANTTPVLPPSWPPFKPALPVVDLELESIVRDKVMVLRSFFPRSLCRDFVSFLRTLPLTTTPGKPKRGMALRVNDRFQIDDSAFAHRLWAETGLREVLGQTDMSSLWFVFPPLLTVPPLFFLPQERIILPSNSVMSTKVQYGLKNFKGR